jgi:hypothetical protein
MMALSRFCAVKRWNEGVMGRFVGIVCLLWMSAVGAHDSITADKVKDYLSRAESLQKTLGSKPARAVAAQASLDLGRMLDEVGELFNLDIDAHGKVQGLASAFLMNELAARGLPLAYSAPTRRYAANLQWYRDALSSAPAGPIAAEAGFRLVKGYFYESFDADPLRPLDPNASRLAEHIRLAETWRNRLEDVKGREEMLFILAILHMQAIEIRQAAELATHLQKSHTLVEEFLKTYPQSMRALTLGALQERVEKR